MSDVPIRPDDLASVAVATLDECGVLLRANAAFLRLADLPGEPKAGTHVDRLFLQPDFATLVRARPDADGRIHEGLLTLGEFTGRTRTLNARVSREGARLHLLAEHDVDGLERLADTVLELNRDYAHSQADLARANLELQAANARLLQAQTKLVEAEKMASLGVLVAGVAHEISTPVGIGLLAATTLHDDAGELARRVAARTLTEGDLVKFADRAATGTDLIHRNLERIGRLVDAFRGVAVQGRSLEKRTFAVREFLGDVVRSLGKRLPADRVDVRIDCPADLSFDGDTEDWTGIFTHLIVNAVQHGFRQRPHGVIDIRIARDGSTLRIVFRDDGEGMSADALARVFDPFFTTDLARGMGLGMHVVYNLVTHRLGGTIRCESRPGEGACFVIELPA